MVLSAATAALLQQARAAHDSKDFHGSGHLSERVLDADCRHVGALHMLGISLFHRADYAAAADRLGRAVALTPRSVGLRLDYAAALAMLDRVEQAILVLAAGLAYHPADPELSKHLGKLLTRLNRHAEAQAVLQAAVAKAPSRPDLLCELAIEYAGDLRLHEALVLLNIANLRRPEDCSIHLNIGTVQQALGDLGQAVRHHRLAIKHAPDNIQAHINLAMALLAGFDFTTGYAEHEWRLKLPSMAKPATAPPRWRGEALAGRRLLVTVEQGLGDTMQYLRFLGPLAAHGGRILLECRSELHRLCAALPGIETYAAAPGDPLPEADFLVPLMSLPFMLGCTEEFLQASIPYLAPPPGPRFELPSGAGTKIGLVWASSPGRGGLFMRRSLDRRSCPLAALAPLAAVPGTQFFSLQKGDPATQLAASGLPIHGLGDRLHDFADTAAVIAELDLVIAVDTSVAHLAGAMGKPVWLMLAEGQADYRWGIGTDTTPWYPTARLFRADRSGWAELARRVTQALQDWVAALSTHP